MTVITMSRKELARLQTLIDLADGRIGVDAAAALMGLGRRQVYRLINDFRASGPDALVSKRRGKPSNHAHGAIFRKTVLGIVQERYADFGPTLAAEKLAERHGLPIGVETLRQWMIDAGIWTRRRDRITYDWVARVDQGAIVENKRLGAALEMCRKLQAQMPPKLRSRSAPMRSAQTGHMFAPAEILPASR